MARGGRAEQVARGGRPAPSERVARADRIDRVDSVESAGRESDCGLVKGTATEKNKNQSFGKGHGIAGTIDTSAAPTCKQYSQAAEFFDLTFKFETLLDSLAEIFRWTSFSEGLLFFVATIFFSSGWDNSVWFLVLALFHVVRALVGFGIGRVVPSSYDFVEKLEFKGEKQLSYHQVRPELARKV